MHARGRVWRSELAEQVGKSSMQVSKPEGWRAYISGLKQKGVKPDEIEWSGVDEWLKLQPAKVSKQQVLDYLDQNGVQVEEVELGTENQHRDKGRAAKYGSYTLPGGQNYRELLLTLPTKPGKAQDRMLRADRALRAYLENEKAFTREGARDYALDTARGELTDGQLRFVRSDATHQQLVDEQRAAWMEREEAQKNGGESYKSSHWDDQNVLAHIRFNERTDAEGKKVLFVEELQSDWAQEGRRKGFKGDEAKPLSQEQERAVREHYAMLVRQRPRVFDGGASTVGEMIAQMGMVEVNAAMSDADLPLVDASANDYVRAGMVPRAPFVDKTDAWLALALKRVVKYAADNGFDRVAFANGQQSADRYDLSKQVDQISYSKVDDERYSISVRKDREEVLNRTATAAELEEIVGKEVAKKIVDGVGREVGAPPGSGELRGLDLKVGGEGMRAFYDKIVPAAANKLLAKLGGGKVQPVGVQVPIQDYERTARYVGPVHTFQDVNRLYLLSKRSGAPVHDNPLTGRREEFSINRVAVEADLRKMMELMRQRKSFTEAIVHPDVSGAVAELFGGRIDRFDAGNDTLEQFGFDITPAMRGEAERGMPMFAREKRGDEQPMPSGLTMEEARRQIAAMRGARVDKVRDLVDVLAAGWKNAPRITVVQTAADLPGENPPDVRGLYQRGAVWIVAGSHRDGATLRRSLARTLAHEVIAHFGLRDMLGREGWARLMRDIQLGIRAKNAELVRIQKFVRETYVDEDGKLYLNEAQEADEIAAKAVEEAIDADGNFRPGFSFLKAVWARVAQFLRDLGISVTFSNAELQGMLVLSMRNLEAGARTAGAGQLAVAAAREDGRMEARADHSVTVKRIDDRWAVVRTTPDGGEQHDYFDTETEARAAATVARAERSAAADQAQRVRDSGAGLRGSAAVVGRGAGARAAPAKPESVGRTELRVGSVAARVLVRRKTDSVASRADLMRRLREGTLRQDSDRAGHCYGMAAAAASDGLGDMVIGLNTSPASGEQEWHAVVQTSDGATYDPTMRQWFEPGVYEASGFSPRSRLSSEQVREFVQQNNGQAPNAQNQGLVDDGFDGTQQARGSDITDSPEFRRWFAGSKVVDAEGKPLVVYHGSPGNITEFKSHRQVQNEQGEGWRQGNEGIYFAADQRIASQYGKDGAVYPVYLAIRNPFVVGEGRTFDPNSIRGRVAKAVSKKLFERANAEQGLRDAMGDSGTYVSEKDKAELTRLGYDGILSKSAHRSTQVWIVFKPEQIKSAIGNRGTFDPFDADIRHARGTTADPQQDEAAEAPPRATSPWRDATGRLQFAPGAWLFEKMGAAAGPLLSKLQLKATSPELRRALREMKLQVAKAQETAGAVATEAMKLTADERAMVSDLIERELAAGVTPPEHAVRLAAMINASMGAQTDELVRLGMLTPESAEMWRGKYLPRFYRSKLGKQVTDAWADAVQRMLGRTRVMAGIKGKHLRGRGLNQPVAASAVAEWESLGWRVRDDDLPNGTTADDIKSMILEGKLAPEDAVNVWRDFTREERDAMGEIRDAGFRFVMGYMQTQRDIALGRLFEGLAQDPDMSGKRETETFSVQVPDGTVPGTGAKRYGKLAGRWVSKDTMSHLSQIEEAQSDAWKMYRTAMGLWKQGKTSMNPVAHVNNILSNTSMAHFAGVSYWEAHKYLAAARDFAFKAEGVKEAKDAGLFLGTLSDAELMNVLPEDLKALVRQQDSSAKKIGRTAFDVMTFFLRRPLGWAYQAEDTFFRYLIYKDARGRGMEPGDAVDYAQKFIFAYDDLPKGARMARDVWVPFFGYTYKVIPALLETALTHPIRFASPAAVLFAANAIGYAIATGGDEGDEWDEALRKYLTDEAFRAKAREKEKLERELLPKWMRGTTALFTPRAIRLGMDEVTKLPVFADVSRIIPGGDIFDVSPNADGVPIPQWMMPSNPLLTTVIAMTANKDLYFGKELVDSNDTKAEATEKRLAWLWRQASPAIAVGNYHFERGMNALAQASGGEVTWLPEWLSEDYTGIGRDGLPVQPKYAAMQTFGIKVRPLDLEMSERIENSQRQKLLRDIDSEMRRLRRLNNSGALSDKVFERERNKADEKKDRIRQGLTVDGNVRD